MTMKDKLKEITSEEGANWIEEAEQDLRQSRVRQKSWKIALRVLTLLKQQGLSQTELANKMGVSRQQVTKIVKGKENLTLETIDKLEQALGETLLDVPVASSAIPAPLLVPQVYFGGNYLIDIDVVQGNNLIIFSGEDNLSPKSYPLAAPGIGGLDFPAMLQETIRETINIGRISPEATYGRNWHQDWVRFTSTLVKKGDEFIRRESEEDLCNMS